MDPVQDFVYALSTRAWYPAIAYGIAFLIAIFRRWQPELFDRIPPRIQWLPAVFLAGATAFVTSFTSGLTWQVALGMAAYTMFIGGPAAVGVHRIAKESAVKTGDGVALGVALFLWFGSTFPSVGCAAWKPVVRDVNRDVALLLCGNFFAKRNSVSLDDAEKLYCDDLAPWLDAVLRAQRVAGARALSPPLAPVVPDAGGAP